MTLLQPYTVVLFYSENFLFTYKSHISALHKKMILSSLTIPLPTKQLRGLGTETYD